MRVEGVNRKRIVEQQAQHAAASTGEAADHAEAAANNALHLTASSVRSAPAFGGR
jgi:hypothetical protein